MKMRPPKSQRNLRYIISVSILFVLLAVSTEGYSGEHSESYNPNHSAFVTVAVGSALNPVRDNRSPVDMDGNRPEAYSLGAFLIGVSGGFRFNEKIGLEGGWHEARYRAYGEWGKAARYANGHLAIRLAAPLATRQTPLLKLGAAVGRFAFGRSSSGQTENNGTMIVGPLAAVALEHELTLGLTATVELAYLALFRKGMSGVLVLEEVSYTPEGSSSSSVIDKKDFTDSTFVHTIWLTVGVQFEWTFK